MFQILQFMQFLASGSGKCKGLQAFHDIATVPGRNLAPPRTFPRMLYVLGEKVYAFWEIISFIASMKE